MTWQTDHINHLRTIVTTQAELITSLTETLARQWKTRDEITALLGSVDALQAANETLETANAALLAQIAAGENATAAMAEAVAANLAQAVANDALLPDLVV